MKENEILHMKMSTQNIACSRCQMHSERERVLIQRNFRTWYNDEWMWLEQFWQMVLSCIRYRWVIFCVLLTADTHVHTHTHTHTHTYAHTHRHACTCTHTHACMSAPRAHTHTHTHWHTQPFSKVKAIVLKSGHQLEWQRLGKVPWQVLSCQNKAQQWRQLLCVTP